MEEGLILKDNFLDNCGQSVLEEKNISNFLGWGEAGFVLHFVLLRVPAMQINWGLYPLKHIYRGNS